MTTREQIIAAARKADPGFGSHTLGGSVVGFDAVERFYASVFEAGRVAEREETNRRPLPDNTAPYIRARSTK